MSNPAVTKLAKGEIGKLRFWMDDNIGESIHIHLADFRLDLTIKELDQLSEELKDTINQLADVKGFDCNKIDAVYLSLLLAKKMKHLKAVKMDTVQLSKLFVNHKTRFGFLKYRKLENSRAVKALRGDSRENDAARKSNHIGQTSSQRLDAMKNSIKENGYPYGGEYIILYEDQMLIRDGQHRASCLYVANGDIEVPVLRLYFDRPEITAFSTNYVKQFWGNVRKVRPKHIKKALKTIVKGSYRFLLRWKNQFYLMCHRRRLKLMEQAYFE